MCVIINAQRISPADRPAKLLQMVQIQVCANIRDGDVRWKCKMVMRWKLATYLPAFLGIAFREGTFASLLSLV